jgi:hypothetical protein
MRTRRRTGRAFDRKPAALPPARSAPQASEVHRAPSASALVAGRAPDALSRREAEGGGRRLARRAFLRGAVGLALALRLPWPTMALAEAARESEGLGPRTLELLERSGFVYVSPLRADGGESACHGEVWFGWLDGAVVLITSRTGWKARALARGLDRARVWVGDHGRWKRLVGTNEAFRQAPSFDARVSRSEEAALLERLILLYREKYPGEIGRWEERFRSGFASGERILLRYEPL